MVTTDATDLPLDESMVVIGQTISSVRPKRRTQNLAQKHSDNWGMILNNAHVPSAGNIIMREVNCKPHCECAYVSQEDHCILLVTDLRFAVQTHRTISV